MGTGYRYILYYFSNLRKFIYSFNMICTDRRISLTLESCRLPNYFLIYNYTTQRLGWFSWSSRRRKNQRKKPFSEYDVTILLFPDNFFVGTALAKYTENMRPRWIGSDKRLVRYDTMTGSSFSPLLVHRKGYIT